MKMSLQYSIALAALHITSAAAAQAPGDAAPGITNPMPPAATAPGAAATVSSSPAAAQQAAMVAAAPPPQPGSYVWVGPLPPPDGQSAAAAAGTPSSSDLGRHALNAVYVELGGNGIVYSLNYERFLTEGLSARAGIGYLSIGDSSLGGASASLTTVPLMLNYLLGSGHHRFELGAGLVLLSMSARAVGFASDFGSGLLVGGAGCAAYRYAPLDGGFNFKVGLTPTLASFGFYPTLGVSLGMLL